jgi:hypothetical protein
MYITVKNTAPTQRSGSWRSPAYRTTGPDSGCQRKTCNLVKTTVESLYSNVPQLFWLNTQLGSQNSGPETRLTGVLRCLIPEDGDGPDFRGIRMQNQAPECGF